MSSHFPVQLSSTCLTSHQTRGHISEEIGETLTSGKEPRTSWGKSDRTNWPTSSYWHGWKQPFLVLHIYKNHIIRNEICGISDSQDENIIDVRSFCFGSFSEFMLLFRHTFENKNKWWNKSLVVKNGQTEGEKYTRIRHKNLNVIHCTKITANLPHVSFWIVHLSIPASRLAVHTS